MDSANFPSSPQPPTADFVKAIREIPFRFMAVENAIDTQVFLSRVYKCEKLFNFFLSDTCSPRFENACKILMGQPAIHIRYRAWKWEKERVQLMEKEKMRPKQQSYSNVVLQSAQKDPITTTTPPPPAYLSREYLENISPSAISHDFKEYSTVDFELETPNEVYGDYQEVLVESFLEILRFDELLAVMVYCSDMSLEDTLFLCQFIEAFEHRQYLSLMQEEERKKAVHRAKQRGEDSSVFDIEREFPPLFERI